MTEKKNQKVVRVLYFRQIIRKQTKHEMQD